MKAHVLMLAILLLPVPSGWSQDGKPSADDSAQLAARIDAILDARIADANITAAAGADDAAFLRRVWLDVAGRIPPAGEVQRFLADENPDKRRTVVAKLLNSPNYVVHQSRVWRAVLIPEANMDFTTRFLVPGFERWLQSRFAKNQPLDELTRELLTAPMTDFPEQNTASPLAFFYAKKTEPENLAAATSRVFLGVRIECAQCHDHPFDEWKREDFWRLAAFYSTMRRQPGRRSPLARIFEFVNRDTKLKIPGTTQTVRPGFLGEDEATNVAAGNARKRLAEWVTSDSNPWFARTAANRMWGQFFGRGLVNPIDDFSKNNTASHPALLDLLGKELAEHDFDLQYMMSAITQTKAYQRSSRQIEPGQSESDAELFARMSLKGLTAHQLYDSIAQATGTVVPAIRQPNQAIGRPESQFFETFEEGPEAPTDRQTSVLQALLSMNGKLMGDATDIRRGRTLAGIAEYPLFSTEERIEALFVATLSRKPAPAELQRFRDYVNAAGAVGDPRVPLADVMWALLNSSEFATNH